MSASRNRMATRTGKSATPPSFRRFIAALEALRSGQPQRSKPKPIRWDHEPPRSTRADRKAAHRAKMAAKRSGGWPRSRIVPAKRRRLGVRR